MAGPADATVVENSPNTSCFLPRLTLFSYYVSRATLTGLLTRPELMLLETAVVMSTVVQVGLRPDRVNGKAIGL